MKKITYRKLQALGACKDHVAIFKATWPEGVEPSLAAFRKAAKLQLDLTWFMRSLLRGSPQLVSFNDAIVAANKTCDEATAPARKALAEATAAANKAYDEAIAPARKAYAEATAPARKAYYEAPATITWEFYKEYCK